MKFATLYNETADGRLLVVSRDGTKAVDASSICPNLLFALECWDSVYEELERLYEQLNHGEIKGSFEFDFQVCAAPLPRSPQWLDASAFLNHGELMQRAFNTTPITDFDTVPVIYQGASDDFYGPAQDVPFPSEEDGIDFEGEFGVVVDSVPMGISPEEALGRIRLIVQINDWSLRVLGPREMKTGFGFVQAKPSSSFAPVAVTPDELGDAWSQGRIAMRLHVDCNDEWIGEPNGKEMNFSFGDLIAHAARTRNLKPGTIVGSGTVSNLDRKAGSACLAEKRVIEKLDLGKVSTDFMRFGDRVRMQARFEDGRNGPFGIIDQLVVSNID